MEPLVNKSCIFCVVLVFFCPAGTASGRAIYVDADAAGANKGSTWQNAYRYLQDALADANSAAKPVEIRIAQGIYKPDKGVGWTAGDQDATFQLINGVTLKGGYAGFGETHPNARNITKYKTILSGDLGGNDIEVKDPCDLLHEPTRAENTFHVVNGSGTDATAILDGFTIVGGNFTPICDHGPCGGAGMLNDSGSPTLINCVFTKNAISQMGGGIYNKNGSSPVLINCVFYKNWAGDGGAMINYLNSSPRLTNCTFVRNSAYSGSNGISSWNNSVPRLTNCILWDNGGSDESSQIRGQTSIVNYCSIQGWTGNLGGTGNIDSDPCFVDAGHWEDPCDTPDDPLDDVWVDGDYHLKSEGGRWDENEGGWRKDEVTSRCIDAGDPMSPIGYEPFPNGGRINMGAYGGTIEASKSYFGKPLCETIIAGDINGDCKVDFQDLVIMAAHWLEDNTPVNSNSILKDGIKYYMQTDKSIYHQGENVEMLYRVTNLRGEDVIFRFYDRVQYYFLVTSGGDPTWFAPKAGLPALSSFVLHPDGSNEYTETWNVIDENGTPWTPGDDFVALPGPYDVTGSLSDFLFEEDKDKYLPVSVQIEIVP